MAYTIKYYLHYGIFGRQLFDTIVSWGTAGKVALSGLLSLSRSCLFCGVSTRRAAAQTKKSPGRREKTVGSDMETRIRLLWKLLI